MDTGFEGFLRVREKGITFRIHPTFEWVARAG
jgi:hypothetical protein